MKWSDCECPLNVCPGLFVNPRFEMMRNDNMLQHMITYSNINYVRLNWDNLKSSRLFLFWFNRRRLRRRHLLGPWKKLSMIMKVSWTVLFIPFSNWMFNSLLHILHVCVRLVGLIYQYIFHFLVCCLYVLVYCRFDPLVNLGEVRYIDQLVVLDWLDELIKSYCKKEAVTLF